MSENRVRDLIQRKAEESGMALLSKSTVRMQCLGEGTEFTIFSADRHVLHLSRQDWVDMGKPEVIMVTIEPRDQGE